MDDNTKNAIIADYYRSKDKEKHHYKPDEFFFAYHDGVSVSRMVRPYSKIRLRKKRSRKKFEKNYTKYLGKTVIHSVYGLLFILPLTRRLNYSEIGRKLCAVSPLPEGAMSKFIRKEEDEKIMGFINVE